MSRADCPVCPKRDADEAEMRALIADYLEALPEEQKTDPETKARRLAACEACEKRNVLICGECGCFTETRAAKKTMRCPHPAGDRWAEE